MAKPTRKLPEFVEEIRLKSGALRYRSWIPAGRSGKRVWTRRVDDPILARRLRDRAIRLCDAAPTRAHSLADVVERVEAEITTDGTAGYLRWFRGHSALILERFGAKTQVHRIRAEQIQAFKRVRLLEVSPASVRHDFSVLSLVFRYAVRHDILDRNPLDKVKRPRVDGREMDWFTQEELVTIVERVQASGFPSANTDAAIISTLYLTGLRLSELARLQVTDVDLVRRTIWIRGKRRHEQAGIALEAAAALRVLMAGPCGTTRDNAGQRGTTRDKGPVVDGGYEAIRRCFRRWQARLKEPRLHAHALRHSFVTTLVQAGHDLDVVMDHARIRSVATVLRYNHRRVDPAQVLGALSLRRGSPLRRVSD